MFKKKNTTYTIVTDTSIITSDEPQILEFLTPQNIIIFPREVSYDELKSRGLIGKDARKITKDLKL